MNKKSEIRKPALLLVYGEGGHCEAMHRLHHHIEKDGLTIIQLRESGSIEFSDYPDYTVPRIMPKKTGKLRILATPYRILLNLLTVLRIYSRYRVELTITTGPIIAFIPCFFAKATGKPCLFIESWARFSSLSTTCKALKAIGCIIWHQNWELTPRLPNGRYCGRL